MKWLFSSSPDATGGSAESEGAPITMTVDEGSTIETPHASYSAVHHHNGNGHGHHHHDDAGTNGNGNGNAVLSEMKIHVNDNCARQATENGVMESNTPPISHANKKRPQRGIIYFRRISSSDRSIIQTLHEQWFPVDYKSEFFDSLCSERPLALGGGMMNSPLYCSVACFRELDEVEWEERCKRKRDRDQARKENSWSFWSGGGVSKEIIDGHNSGSSNNYEEEDDDCILWEMDDSIEENDGCGNGSTDTTDSYHDETPYSSLSSDNGRSRKSTEPHTNNASSSSASNVNGAKNDDDDVMESGENVFSIHHRNERGRMERFYSNGFRFDSADISTTENNMQHQNGNGECSFDESKHQKKKAKQQHDNNSNNHNTNNTNTEGPYYNSTGERIVGCIVGSFLPSTLPSNRHRTSLDQKIGRDETAQLLVPDSERFQKMFYIMTLGTTREVRRCGLGSILVNRVVDEIEEVKQGDGEDKENEERCGALYLHVITYNEGAIRLYERLGFVRVKEIKDYYTINSVNYDCYLYARYFHGNRGHKTTLSGVLYDFASSIIRKFSNVFIPTS